MGGELAAVRAEGVRLDHLRAGGEVLAMQAFHERRPRRVQLVEAAIVRHPARVEQGPDRAVHEQWAAVHALAESWRPGHVTSNPAGRVKQC